LDYIVEEIADSQNKRLAIEIPPETDSGLIHSNDEGVIGFNFNNVFSTDATQEQVFEHIAKQKVLDIFSGLNATVFAYGQTGSGKTFSIFGGDTFQDRGLIPRSLGQIFQEIKIRSNPEEEFTCKISFTEVYKENLYDLLDPNKRHVPMEQWVPVQMFESEQGLMLRNVNVFEVDSEEKSLNLFFMGNTNRITASTQMNNASSRSHAVFTVIVESKRLVENPLARNFAVANGDMLDALPSSHEYLTGKLNMVDLAGSERMYKLQNSRNLISQAKSINLSLHFLEQVIISLRDSNSKIVNGKSTARAQHIPYRNSVLTSMLRDSLGGNCKSCFLLTIASERLHFEETVSTCRFGQRCGEVLVDVHVNKEVSSDDELLELRLRNEALTKQLRVVERSRDQLREEKAEVQAELGEVREKLINGAGIAADPTVVPPSRELSDEDHLFVSDTLGGLLTSIEDNMAVCRDQLTDDAPVDENYFDLGFDEVRTSFLNQVAGKDYSMVMDVSQALVVLVHQLFKEKEVENRRLQQLLRASEAAAEMRRSASGTGFGEWPTRVGTEEQLTGTGVTPMPSGTGTESDPNDITPRRVAPVDTAYTGIYNTPSHGVRAAASGGPSATPNPDLDPNFTPAGQELADLSPVPSAPSTPAPPMESLDVNYVVIPSPMPPRPPLSPTASTASSSPRPDAGDVADLTGPLPLCRLSYITHAQMKLLSSGAMFCKLPSSAKSLKGMLRTASATKQLRYVCVSHDCKYLKWKSFSTTNHKKERAFGQSQADADVDNYKYLNSPVPVGKGAVSAKSAESSFLALSSIDSVTLEDNPLQQGDMSKFSLWGSSAAATTNNNCPVLLISGLGGEKVLRLEFFCSVSEGNRQTVSSNTKHDLTVMWLDALLAAIQQAQMVEKRERENEGNPHRISVIDGGTGAQHTTYNMVNSGYIKKKMFQRDLMTGVKHNK